MQFRTLLDRFTAAVEANDTEAFCGLFAPDGTYDDVFYGVFRGHDELVRMLREHFHGNAEDFRWQMHEPVCDGHIGYANYTFSYTSTMKHSAGRRVLFTGCSQFRLDGSGKIAAYREWAFATAGLAQLEAPPEVLVRQARRESERVRAHADRKTHRI